MQNVAFFQHKLNIKVLCTFVMERQLCRTFISIKLIEHFVKAPSAAPTAVNH